MQILIGCAKIMTGSAADYGSIATSTPAFLPEARRLAALIARYGPDELADMLRINPALALENWKRYQNFFDESRRVPAVMGYDGMVFRKLSPETMTAADLEYAGSHLFIASFLYGLLRPLDLINPYRLEGNVVLPENDHLTMFDYWKPVLTRWFISRIEADDGILVNLASNEFRDIFDWKEVTRRVRVITPRFMVAKDGSKPKTVVIYAKMCRGAMARFIIRNRLTDPSLLHTFSYEGFEYAGDDQFILTC